MEIEVPDYNTVVEFPDDMDMEKARSILAKRFPPIDRTFDNLVPQNWDMYTEEDYQKVADALRYSNSFDLTGDQSVEYTDEIRKIEQRMKSRSRGVTGDFGTRPGEALAAGLQTSVPGLAATLATGQKLPDFEAAGTVEEVLQGFGQLWGDFGLMMVGNMIGGGPTSLSGWGGSFALPQGLRQVYMDKIQKGEVEGFGDFMERLGGAVKETLKGELTGAATGAAGKISPWGFKTAAEIGTMTTVGSLLEGQIPEKKDFINAAIMVGGMKMSARAATVISNKFQQLYRDRNIKPDEVAAKVEEELAKQTPRPFSDLLESLEEVERAAAAPEPADRFTATDTGIVRTEPNEKEIMSVIDRYREQQMDEAFKTEAEVPREKAPEASKAPELTGLEDLEAQAGLVSKPEYERAILKLMEIDRQKARDEWYEGQQIESIGNIIADIERQLSVGEKETPSEPVAEIATTENWYGPKSAPEGEKLAAVKIGEDTYVGGDGHVSTMTIFPEINERLKANPNLKVESGWIDDKGEFTTGKSVRKESTTVPTEDTTPKPPLQAEPAVEGKVETPVSRSATEILSDVSSLMSDKNTTLGSLFGPLQRLYEIAAGIDLTPEQMAARSRLMNDMKVAAEEANKRNVGLREYLKSQGMDDNTADRLMIFAPQPKAKAAEYSPDDPVIKQRTIGKKENELYAPALRESDRAGVESMSDIGQHWYGLTNPIYVFERMGKWAMDNIYHPMKAAEDAAKRDFLRIKDSIITPFKKELSKESAERIGAYAVAQQAKGERILKYMGIEEIPTLTPREMEAYNTMRTELESLYDRLQVARAMSGKEPFKKVDNYFTFFHEMSLLDKMGLNPILGKVSLFEKTIDNLKAEYIHRKTTPFRFAKQRNNAIYPVDLNAFRIFEKYADAATNHIAKSPVIAKSREFLLKFPDGYKLWDENPNTAKWLTQWLDYQTGQRPMKPDWLPETADKIIGKLNKNLAFATLSLAIRSALIQPTSLLSTVTEIGVNNTRKGVAELFDSDRVKFAMDNSKVLLSREFDINVTEALQGVAGRLMDVKQWVGEKGLSPLKYLDMKAATATWLGAFEKGKSEKMTDSEAAIYADDTVTKTQASAQRSDLAPMQRSNIGKALTLFQTFVINQWNWLVKDVAGINNPKVSKEEAFKKVATFIAGATLVNILFEDILGINSPFPTPINVFIDSIEKGDDPLSASKNAALEMLSIAPMMGGARYGSAPYGATAELGKDVAEYLAGRPDAKSGWELAGKIAGVPGTTQIKKVMEAETLKEATLGKEPK